MNSPPALIGEWIPTLARHALAGFGIGLVLLLGCVAVLWWLLQRYGVHREHSRLSPLVYLLRHLAFGFVVIVSAAGLFAAIAEELGDGEALGKLDLLFSDTVRATVSLNVLQVFAILTRLGNTPTLVVLCAVVALGLLWRRHHGLCLAWLLAVNGNALLNVTLKGIFERTRPLHEHGLVLADGWSFPSGHASGSVVAYGMLAYLTLRLLPANVPGSLRLAVVLVAAATAFTTGCSRVFLQVHFSTDVLAGFASGTAWLAVCISTMELLRYRNRPAPSKPAKTADF